MTGPLELPTGNEDQHFDRKSLRKVLGPKADFIELAKDCVAFANAGAGTLFIGIEDGETEPPAGQTIPRDLAGRVRRRVGELTVNVETVAELRTSAGGGEVLVLAVRHSAGVASTHDGRYYLRVGDESRPVVGDEILRLLNDRSAAPWETLTSQDLPPSQADPRRRESLCQALRASERVKDSVKEKSDGELLDHYGLVLRDRLTNLGVLLLGTAADRARLGSAPVIQAIIYDERGAKIDKAVWDDHQRSPLELVDAVWRELPVFRESYEVPDGLLRSRVPAYDEAVIRELLVNALVHRPYTQRGDIFLNLHPDRLEVVNAGRLPLGVTPRNILHASRRRNDGLARVFHDLQLMEREGSGFDLMYDRLLASGRGAPEVQEGTDSVHVTVPRRIVHPGVVRLITVADQRHQLTQRERIALGLLGQGEGMTALELAAALELADPDHLRLWLGRLVELGIVHTAGRTKGTRYFVDPALLRASGLDVSTTLRRIQPHRLRALIIEDLGRYPGSSASEIHRRVGAEIPDRTFRRALGELVEAGELSHRGERRWRRYYPGALSAS